ncbi:MAG: hypothetical protein K6C09_10070 [Oscillospiraceae bacterium]|nr:hypothetical protein [Oscillospiraceae bacterium]
MAVLLSVLFLFTCGCAKDEKTSADDDSAAAITSEADISNENEDEESGEGNMSGEAAASVADDIPGNAGLTEEADQTGEEEPHGEEELPAEAGDPSETEIPAEPEETAETDGSAEERETAEEDGTPELTGGTKFYGDYMRLFFSVPSGWRVLDRSEIAARLGYTEEYVRDDPAQILWNYYPYYELWAEDGSGNMVQFIIENTPVFSMDGTSMETAEDYQDHNAEVFPEAYQSMGIEVFGEERSVVKIDGHSYESFSFSAKVGEYTVTQTMLSRKNGACMCTIYLTCTDEALEEQLMSRIFGKD